MIAFDTNYLVRHIVQDDEEQCAIVATELANEIKKERSIRIFDLVLMETSWVLETVYGFDRVAWAQVLEELLDDSAFSFDDPGRLCTTIKVYRQGRAGFADYLIAETARSEFCEICGLGACRTFSLQFSE